VRLAVFRTAGFRYRSGCLPDAHDNLCEEIILYKCGGCRVGITSARFRCIGLRGIPWCFLWWFHWRVIGRVFVFTPSPCGFHEATLVSSIFATHDGEEWVSDAQSPVYRTGQSL
jgi:hypothetical protein